MTCPRYPHYPQNYPQKVSSGLNVVVIDFLISIHIILKILVIKLINVNFIVFYLNDSVAKQVIITL